MVANRITAGQLFHDNAHHFDKSVSAGGHQLSSDQPYPAPSAHALHGLVQQDRAAARARCINCVMAALLRSGFERSTQKTVQERALLLHPRAHARGPTTLLRSPT